MELQNKLNSYIEFVKTHKNKLSIVAGIVLVIILIISMLIYTLTSSSSDKKAPVISPTSIPVPTMNITISPTMKPRITETPSQATIIYEQVKPQLDNKIPIPYSVKKTTSYGDDWAIIEVNIPTTDPANIIVKKENGTWTIKLGPGTSFDPVDLQEIGAPQDLMIGANSDF